MQINKAKELIRWMAENEVDVPLLMIGGMGIGKSDIVESVAKELGIGYFAWYFSSNTDTSDMAGVLYREGNKHYWTLPENWPTGEDSRGIAFYDELNRAPLDLRQPLLQLLRKKVFHVHKLPKRWIQVIAINPDNGEFQTESLDKALLRRCVVIKVETNVKTWSSWAKENLNETIVDFIEENPEMLLKEEKHEIKIERNPDAYSMLYNFINNKNWNELNKDIQFEICQGLIEKECAIAFFSFLEKEIKPITGKELFKNYKNTKEKFLKQKISLLNKSLESVGEEVNNSETLSEKEIKILEDLLLSLPAEFQISLVLSINFDILSEKIRPIIHGEKNKENKDCIICKIAKKQDLYEKQIEKEAIQQPPA